MYLVENIQEVNGKERYQQSQVSHTLFVKHFAQGKVTTLIVYVGDIVVTRDDVDEIRGLKSYLKYEQKVLDTFLELKLQGQNKEFLFLNKNVLDLLKEVDLLDCKNS